MKTNPSQYEVTAAVSEGGETAEASGRSSGAFPFLLGSALLGTIGVFVHLAHADPLTATWFRCAFGLLGLTVWLRLRKQTGSLRLTRANGVWILAAGTLMVVAWGTFFAAIEHVSTGVAVVLFHIQPLWVLLLAALFLRESIGRRRIASVCVAMLGLVLATGVLNNASSFAAAGKLRTGYWLGIAACLIGAFCTACVTIIARRLRKVPTGTVAWWQCALGTSMLWVWPALHGWPAWGASWLWLAGLGLIHTGWAYTLIYAGMARMSTDRIAVFQFLYPAVAVVIDWLYFDQQLGSVQLIGIALISAAVWFAERVPRT